MYFPKPALFLSAARNYNNPTITSWTGNVSTDWNNTGNRDNGVPDLSITAVIPDERGASGNFPDII